MNRQVVTRRGLIVLGILALAGQATADDKERGSPHTRHRGYKVGGGMVAVIMLAVFGSMALFGEFRHRRAPPSALPSPEPLPEEAVWGEAVWEAEYPSTPLPDASVPGSSRQRRARRGATVESGPEG